ncbi:MAG: hypothetical protein KKA60_03595, partial [Proteobacteria bacterium]|nr:hypothetical protein [Pseudomonadota bacterium]
RQIQKFELAFQAGPTGHIPIQFPKKEPSAGEPNQGRPNKTVSCPVLSLTSKVRNFQLLR